MALIALATIALIAAMAIALDVGRLVTARTEAQRVADAAALAGAGILAVDPENEGSARTEAVQFAARNTVCGTPIDLEPEDVAVDLDASTVEVTVRCTAERGTAIRTFFARAFGVYQVDVTARARAIAEPAGPGSQAGCLLPVMLPDRWLERPGVFPAATDSFDPEVPDPKPNDLDGDGVWDVYVPSSEVSPGNPSTGYDETVVGARVELHKAGGGGGGVNPSWYFPWTPLDAADQLVDGGGGADNYRSRFTRCLESSYAVGDFVLTEPGAMAGPTRNGFQDVFDADPEVYWNESPTGPSAPPNGRGCPWRPSAAGGNGACDYTTPRIRTIPMFDPREAPDHGRKQVRIRNFGSVFVEDLLPGENYSARWLGVLSSDPDDPGDDDDDEGLQKRLRLIE
jgi:hypothetical protein